MSIERCQGCCQIIDTDFDVECYVPDPRHSLAGFPDTILCEGCRETLGEAEPNFPIPNETEVVHERAR